MTNSKSSNNYNRQNWEQSEFPIVCETCLGDNSFLRMTKEPYGKECKICQRPFTIFRWQPGCKARFKKTEVCQLCAKTKNVCQTCILDLEFGLPVQVRDNALKIAQNLPRGSVNREYNQQQLEQTMSTSRDATAPFGGLDVIGAGGGGAGGKAPKNSDMLLKLARTEPYYRRNRPHICSFYVKGECKRGEECPYRHEKPTDPDDPLSNQNIKDRFYGMADPVAHKLLDKYRSMPQLTVPEDKSITTLYIGGVPDSVGEKELRDRFYQYGELRSVTLYPRQRCAFVQFANRDAAERAAEKSYDKLIMAGQRLTVNWGKAQLLQQSSLSSLGPDGGALMMDHHGHGNKGPQRGHHQQHHHHHHQLPAVPGLPPPPPPSMLMTTFPPPQLLYWPTPMTSSPPSITPMTSSSQVAHHHQQQQQQLPHFNAINSAATIPPPPPPMMPLHTVATAAAALSLATAATATTMGTGTAPIVGHSTITTGAEGRIGVHYPSMDPNRFGDAAN